MKLGPSKPCPCGSKRVYGECCGPLHKHERPAESAEAVMRSRYSAFALGNVAWLIETLAMDHIDREMDERSLAASIREICRTGRFMGLTVLEVVDMGNSARVRFHVRVFTDGRDRSFEENSYFVREDGNWRYLGHADPI